MKKFTLFLFAFLASFVLHAQHTSKYTVHYGTQAGTAGYYNNYFGYGTGKLNTTGSHNAYMGDRAGHVNTIGQRNTLIGSRAGYNSKGSYNTFMGAYTGYYTTNAGSNTFLGYAAGYRNTTGSSNTYVGQRAGNNNKTGSYNVFIGSRAGYTETGSNKLYIDNSSTTTPLIHGDFSTDLLTINGQMRIGNVSTPTGFKLYVDDGILTERVKVATVGSTEWADYVFANDYHLNSTEEVEAFVKENKHLPNVPSARDVSENGVDMVEMDATLLRQIEELWLHVIELKKENDTLKSEVKILKSNK